MPLTGDQYSRVMRIINERQLTAEREAQKRREEIFARLPELKKLRNQVTDAGVTATRKYMAGDTDARAKFEKVRVTAAQMEETILSEAGLTRDDLEPHYTCPDCHDTGFADDGQPCHCFTQLSYDLIYSQDRLRYWMQENNFRNFNLSLYPDSGADPLTGQNCRDVAVDALGIAASFVRNLTGREVDGNAEVMAAIESDPQPADENLIIIGTTGTGKTYLSHCIAKEVLDAGFTCIYLTAAEFVEVAEKAEFQHQPEEFKNCFDCNLLVIDDLGTEMVNTFTSGAVYRIINERLLNRKHTVISTNLRLEDIRDKYSDRIFSRICGGYSIIKLIGPDQRAR